MEAHNFSQDHYPPRTRIIHISVWIALIILNVYLVSHYAPELVTFHRDDFPPGASALWNAVLFNIIVTYNVLGFIAGCLIAMIPIGKLDYGKRYVRISLYTLIAMHLAIAGYAVYKMTLL